MSVTTATDLVVALDATLAPPPPATATVDRAAAPAAATTLDGRTAALGDEHLMVEITAGSVEAFGELYDRYRDRAWRVATSVCRDRVAAEEAIQNAFMAIWKHRSGYRAERGTVSAWLLTVVRHRALDVTRDTGRQDDPAGMTAAPTLGRGVTPGRLGSVPGG